MRKLINSSFELDLSTFKISDTEENNWFSDSFFTKYSFPFDIDLTDDLDVAFGFISLYNTNPQTYYECKYIHNNKIEDAIFEIESHQEKLSCTLRFGFEQLPSFDKKLSELSLDNFNLPEGVDIYEHAETIITQTWPAVNYNFPQVHVDKYDVAENEWNSFDQILNIRKDGAFLINEIDIPNQITYNRNVIQPMPYLIHIIQRGMIDAGYTLSGKILTDDSLKKACVYGDVEYFFKNKLNEYDYRTATLDFISYTTYDTNKYRALYYRSETITGIGNYRLEANIITYSLPTEIAYFKIKLNGTIIYELNRPINDVNNGGNILTSINITFETITNSNVLEFEALGNYDVFSPYNAVFGVIISPVLYYDDATIFVTVINENVVDLTRTVPDITFGDFIKVVKNWFNYDLSVEGNLAIMNPIEDEINYNATLDLSFTEVKYPLRKFSQGSSFLLKFQDIDNKDYTFLPVFQNQSSIVNSGYVTDDKTTTIEVNALPLPLLTRNEVQTAYALESNDAKVYLVKYDGIYNGNNLAQSNADYLIPVVHLAYWTKWFQFRINAHGFNWRFKVWNETIVNLKAKTKIFAYKRVHIIKTINKTEIKPDLFEIELDCEALE